MTKKLTSSDEATVCSAQLTVPCGDCPFSRSSLSGWLGSSTPEEYLALARSDARIDCHTLKIGSTKTRRPMHWQCAGAAIFRANIVKSPRNPEAMKLPANRTAVFSNPDEFLAHHKKRPGRFNEENNPNREQLVALLGWEWEAFEKKARHASTAVLLSVSELLSTPDEDDDEDDEKIPESYRELAGAALSWIEEEIERRNGPVWTESGAAR